MYWFKLSPPFPKASFMFSSLAVVLLFFRQANSESFLYPLFLPPHLPFKSRVHSNLSDNGNVRYADTALAHATVTILLLNQMSSMWVFFHDLSVAFKEYWPYIFFKFSLPLDSGSQHSDFPDNSLKVCFQSPAYFICLPPLNLGFNLAPFYAHLTLFC